MIPLGVLSSRRAAASATATITHRAFVGDGDDLSTYTFAAVPLGPPSASRSIIVAYAHRSNPAVTSFSIAGVEATLDLAAAQGPQGLSIYRAQVPLGSTGDISITLAGTGYRALLGISSVDGEVAVADFATAATKTATLPVDTLAGDILFGAFSTNSGDTPIWGSPLSGNGTLTNETRAGTAHGVSSSGGGIAPTLALSGGTAWASAVIAYRPV